MCGRAMPFGEYRIDLGERLRLEPGRRGGVASSQKRGPVDKAKPYRTSGGIAARERFLIYLCRY
jgi:hypothetical protein